MFSLLGTAEPAELERWFDALADGGEVIDPLALKPWGDHDGQVRDRFGVTWLIGYTG
jgi:PhnB protein